MEFSCWTLNLLFFSGLLFESIVGLLSLYETVNYVISSFPSSLLFCTFYFSVIDGSPAAAEESPQILTFRSPILGPRRMPPIYHSRIQKMSRRKSFTGKHGFPVRAKFFTIADLQSATNSFSEANLLGEGSLGSVYKAEFPDGQVKSQTFLNRLCILDVYYFW